MKLKDPSLLQTRAFIGGAWVEGDVHKTFAVTDPATGEILAEVADVGQAETHRAVEAAESALSAWRVQSAKSRSVILRRWYEQIMQHQDDLAMILSMEQGKPLAESRGEIAYGASFIEWFSEEAKRAYGDVIPSPFTDKRMVTIKQPVGVVAAIAPWNFPNAMITRKVGPALAAGCTVVVKPASETPLSTLALAALGERAGLPDGVLNVVVGTQASKIGSVLTSHPAVRKLSFTGSTQIGKLLMEQCAGTVKKLALELGGNAPFLVFDDADLDAAVQGAIASKFRNTGQTCVCANRILVQDDVYDAFAAKLTESVRKLNVGPATQENVQLGPLINATSLAKVVEHIDDALSKGALLATGGKAHELGGNFFEPTVLVDVRDNMLVANEETFGPVAPLFRFKDEAEAIRLANATEFGLAAYLYSRDIGRIWRVAEAIEAGMVGINEGIISTEVAPFGGIKESGVGREGSRYGLEEFMEIKYLCFGGLSA